MQNKLQFPRLSPLLRRARAWRRRYPTSLLFAELNIQPFARLTFHLPHLGCITNSLPKLHHFCQSKFFRILTNFSKKTKLIRRSVSSGLKFRLKASVADTLTAEESWFLYERGTHLRWINFFMYYNNSKMWKLVVKT